MILICVVRRILYHHLIQTRIDLIPFSPYRVVSTVYPYPLCLHHTIFLIILCSQSSSSDNTSILQPSHHSLQDFYRGNTYMLLFSKHDFDALSFFSVVTTGSSSSRPFILPCSPFSYGPGRQLYHQMFIIAMGLFPGLHQTHQL